MNAHTLLEISMALLCASTIGLHLVRKNLNEVLMYSVQSLAVVLLLAISFTHNNTYGLLAIAVATLVVKVVLAPLFFRRLINRHQLKFAASTHANIPQTVVVLTGMLVLANSRILSPLTTLVPAYHGYLALVLAGILASIFLMVNRKGALSQVVGVLSLENNIVAFAILGGLEQSVALQAGVIFDIFLWLIIAIVMVSMVYSHTGTLDVTNMKKLRH